jgi:hypothetical protein
LKRTNRSVGIVSQTGCPISTFSAVAIDGQGLVKLAGQIDDVVNAYIGQSEAA